LAAGLQEAIFLSLPFLNSIHTYLTQRFTSSDGGEFEVSYADCLKHAEQSMFIKTQMDACPADEDLNIILTDITSATLTQVLAFLKQYITEPMTPLPQVAIWYLQL
jgi:hypothetical protein